MTGAALRQIAESEGALFLLDGLDEAGDDARRARVMEAVEEFMLKAGPKCRFLLTSRPYAWEETTSLTREGSSKKPAARAHAPPPSYRLADLQPEQIQGFVQSWYDAIAALGWINGADAKEKTKSLQGAVTRPDLAILAQNPLLLTLMATLHSNRTRLPDDRADLYNAVVELLLQRWNETIGADQGLLDAIGIPSLKVGDLREKIETLAFEAHAANVGREGAADIAEGGLLEAFRPLLGGSHDKAALVVAYIEKRTGLLLGQGPKGHQRQFTFPHRTFQEYLAACHLARQPDFVTTAAQLARAHPAHWRETLVLAARVAGADRGVPVADKLVQGHCLRDWEAKNKAGDAEWRMAVLAGEQLLEIGLAVVASQPNRAAVRERVTSWLAGLVERGALPPVERARAGSVLGRLGDPRPGVGLDGDRLPDIVWVSIPSGPFLMGSAKGGESYNREYPQFTCKLITQPYQISRYPITVAQYQAFVDAGGYTDKAESWWTKAGWAWKVGQKVTGPRDYDAVFQTPNHPRVGVSWFEAVAYCRWLSVKKGQTIRLPREAEWERAARGVKGRLYPWGGEPDAPQRCNMEFTGIGATSAVGLFPLGDTPPESPNEPGVADMAGNVWEWCQTKWRDDYKNYENAVDEGIEGEDDRALRGGSWFDSAWFCRSAFRFGFRLRPVEGLGFLGFRVCLVPGSADAQGALADRPSA